MGLVMSGSKGHVNIATGFKDSFSFFYTLKRTSLQACGFNMILTNELSGEGIILATISIIQDPHQTDVTNIFQVIPLPTGIMRSYYNRMTS
jgi:hypothetical protein